jgi:transcriptional regulator with PAS, ATPase and Fis domain
MRITMERAVAFYRMKKENEGMKRELANRYHPDNIIGHSEPLRRVLDLIDRVAPTRATALILGESGTGKELVARAIHYRSPRAAGPFVAINCAALTETLLESELSAMSGGLYRRRTLAPGSRGGRRLHIFLDEIGETSNAFQTKLLRVLQDGEIIRVGERSASG